MTSTGEASQSQHVEQNTIIAACIASGEALAVLYAVLVGLGSMRNEAGENVRLWFGCLPWIPKTVRNVEREGEEGGEKQHQLSGEALAEGSIRRAVHQELDGQDRGEGQLGGGPVGSRLYWQEGGQTDSSNSSARGNRRLSVALDKVWRKSQSRADDTRKC